MIDEKVLIEHIKHHRETVYPSHALAAAIYELAHDHFIDMVNIQPKVGGWIPCSERLPEKGQRCVVSYEGNINSVGIEGKYVDIDTFNGIRFNFFGIDKVIAWMPLPTPYDANTEAEKPQWQQQMMDRFLKGE